VPANEPRSYHHSEAEAKRDQDLQKERQVLPVIRNHRFLSGSRENLAADASE
jgi:hypothetical protein